MKRGATLQNPILSMGDLLYKLFFTFKIKRQKVKDIFEYILNYIERLNILTGLDSEGACLQMT